MGVALAMLAMGAATAAAQEAPPATNLPPVTVSAPRLDSPWRHADADAPVSTLGVTPGVALTSQGGPSGQNDLSLRGSSFSGAGLSLAGLSLRNPQTEHFNLELPLSASVLDAPHVLTGVDQALATDGHLVGTVDMELRPVGERTQLDFGAGEHGRNWQNAVYETRLNAAGAPSRAGLRAFGGREEAGAVDYADNAVERLYGGAQLQSRAGDSQSDVVGAVQHKEFGARGYYGVTPDWDADEELDDALVLLTHRTGRTPEDYTRVSASWRRIEDRYRLYWTLPGTYENEHRSDVAEGFADGALPLAGGRGALAWRAGVEAEDLDSSALGDHERQRGVFSLLPWWRAGPWRITAGAREEVFSGDSPAVLPQAGLEYELAPQNRVYASYTETVRQPSYTELNYDSPGSLGNSGLERQRTQQGELGWKWETMPDLILRAAAFTWRSRNTVDWTRETAESTRWTASDLGTVDTRGVEFEAGYSPVAALDCRGTYAWLRKSHDDADPYASRYVLDYPEQRVALAGVWRIGEHVRTVLSQTFRQQTDNPVRASGRSASEGELSVHFTPPRWENVELACGVDNLWDDDFEPLAGQPVAGRRFSTRVRVTW